MRSTSWLALLLGVFVLALIGSTAAQDVPTGPQELPAAPWYIVLFSQPSEELIWVNSEGVQAVTPRILPPDAVEGRPTGIRISPEGHYGLFLSPDAEGRQSVLFYSFESGRPIKTYKAEVGESIAFAPVAHGGGFSQDGTRVVISFNTLGEARQITDWRLIEFDVTTGETLHEIAKRDNVFQYTESASGNAPQVYFAPEDESAYHFTMTPARPDEQTTLEAFAWTPADNTIDTLGTVSSDFDVLVGTGLLLEPFFDETQGSTGIPGGGLVFNALSQRDTPLNLPQSLLVDQEVTMFNPHWASHGAWVFYQSRSLHSENWTFHLPDADLAFPHNTIAPMEFYGTSDGYVMTFGGGTYEAGTKLNGSDRHIIYEALDGEQVSLVYITPSNRPFEGMTLADRPAQAEAAVATDAPTLTSTPTAAAVVCNGAPASRVSVGMHAVLIPEWVRLRRTPNGDVMTSLPTGAEVRIEDGPQCTGGYLWWHVTALKSDFNERATGWIAEGTGGSYFIEPIETPIPDTSIPGDCSSAPERTIAVGDTVVTHTGGSSVTLNMHESATSDDISADIPSGETGTVTDGPVCYKGFRMWEVTFNSGAKGWVADGFERRVSLRKQ